MVRGEDDQAAVHFTAALTTPGADADNLLYNLEGLAPAAAAARTAHGTAADPWWARRVAAVRAEGRQQLPGAAEAAGAAGTPSRPPTTPSTTPGRTGRHGQPAPASPLANITSPSWSPRA